MATPEDDDVLSMPGWPYGVNNRAREYEALAQTDKPIPASQVLREAVNVDLTTLGHPLRRTGYEQLSSGYTHSLWSAPDLDYGLFVRDGWLTSLSEQGLETQLTQVHAYAPMSYATVNGVVYYSNGMDQGCASVLEAWHWGLPTPPEPVAAVSPGGALYAGTYQIALTYVDADLEESGASTVITVAVPANSALTVTIPGPWPSAATTARVYVSQPNGETLYHAQSVNVPATVSITPDNMARGRILDTLDLQPPKPGGIVRYYSGRMYIARRDTVIFTEALRYGLTRPAQGIYMFPADVTLLEPTTDGVYVGYKGGVVFLAGTDPYNVTQVNVLPSSPVPRASCMVPGERLGAGVATVPVWWGQDGAMVAGMPGGQVKQLTRDRLAVPKFQLGAALYREREGISQVVSTLRRGGEQNTMGATDSVVAEIRRNTIQLNT